MKLRELLIGIGFKVNEGTVNAAEKKISKIKDNLDRVGVASTKATNTTSKGMEKVGTTSETANRKAQKALAGIESSARSANSELKKTTGMFSKVISIVGLAGVLAATLSIGNIIKVVDEYKTISGQVRLVTNSQKEATEVQKDLYRMAQRTRQEYSATAQLYTSVARNAGELGKSTAEILAFTEDVSMAMMIGGGSAASQQAALTQLGQALGSGALRGDELNSIMEQAPRLSKLIAEGMGTTIGKLREMGKAGKLSSIDIFNAIRSGSSRLKMEMGKIPWTVDQASIKMRNSMQRFFAGVEERTGVVAGIAQAFAAVSEYIDSIDIDSLVAGFRLLSIYAAAFFVVTKWDALITGMKLLRTAVLGIKDAYLLATGAQVVFRSGSARAAALAIVPLAKIALIAAAISLVVLAIEDFYTWVQGGDSLIGRHFGSWQNCIEELKRRWEQWKNEFSKSIAPLVAAVQPVIDVFKDIVNWIGRGIDKLEQLQQKIANWNPRKKLGELGDFASNIYLGNPNNGADGDYITRSVAKSDTRSFSDQSTHTNNIQVYAQSNATPSEIGAGVADAISPSSSSESDFYSDFDYGYPAVEVP